MSTRTSGIGGRALVVIARQSARGGGHGQAERGRWPGRGHGGAVLAGV